MAETPSLHIDDDWKRQAQEEKRKLAEAEAARKAQATTAPASTAGGAPGAGGGDAATRGGAEGRRGSGARRGEVPPASFAGLVQTLMTQALYYLGEIGTRQGQSAVDLDMARMQIDLLGVLEEKTRNNLTPEETQLLDSTLYETRMRFIAIAREYAEIGQR